MPTWELAAEGSLVLIWWLVCFARWSWYNSLLRQLDILFKQIEFEELGLPPAPREELHTEGEYR